MRRPMAPSIALNQQPVETLPAEFDEWDGAAPPETLPPDFQGFDVSIIEPPTAGAALLSAQENCSGAGTIQNVRGDLLYSQTVTFLTPDRAGFFDMRWKLCGAAGILLLAGSVVAFMSRSPASSSPSRNHVASPAAPPNVLSQSSPDRLPHPQKLANLVTPVPNRGSLMGAEEAAPGSDPHVRINDTVIEDELHRPTQLPRNFTEPAQEDVPLSEQSSLGLSGTSSLMSSLGSVFSSRTHANVRAAPPHRIRVSPEQVMSLALTKTPPQYPTAAKALRVAGSVVIEVVIGPDGKPTNVRPSSGPQVLQQAAVDAVKNWRFRPTLVEGVPVEVISSIRILFTLNH